MNKIFVSVLLFFVLSMTTLVVIKATQSGFSFDTRSRASETMKEKVYPVTGANFDNTVPSFNPDAFVTYIKKNPTAKRIPDSVYVGLYFEKGGSCGDNKKNCMIMPKQKTTMYLTSCVKFGFDLVQNTPINVRYRQSKGPIKAAVCKENYCGTSPGLLMFTSTDNATWIPQTRSIPNSWHTGDSSNADGAYKTVTMPPNAPYKYIVLCRGGGGNGRDSMLINEVYTEKTITKTPTPEPTMSCNYSVNPQRTCPTGYTCVYDKNLGDDGVRKVGTSGTCEKITPTPEPTMSCNYSVNPQRTCPTGYTCVYDKNLGDDGVRKVGTSGTCEKITPTPEPTMSCNYSVNPQRTCPTGYTCVYENDGDKNYRRAAGTDGICKKQ